MFESMFAAPRCKTAERETLSQPPAARGVALSVFTKELKQQKYPF
jgi:hypothetical protein